MLILRRAETSYWGGGLHLTCNTHFQTWPSFSSPKSCVKIWFWLVEPFKSYRGNKQRLKKKKQVKSRSPLMCPERVLPIIGSIWKFGNLPYLVADTCGLNFIKIGVFFNFSGGGRSLLGGLTIIEISWNYGNLPYLVANTKGFNFIKIGGIWIFWGGGGAETPIRLCYIWPLMLIFKLGWAILVKSQMWKFGSDWLSFSRVIIWIFRVGRNPLLGGYMWPAMPLFEHGRAIPVKSHVWKFGSDWLSLSRVIVSTNIFSGGRNPLLGGYIWPVMPIFELEWAIPVKSCVKICFGLVEIRGMLILRGAENPLLREGGGYMWPAMAIFELGWGFLDKSHVWKFCLDWLRLSRVIVVTKIKYNTILGKILFPQIIKQNHRQSST